jgi:hypothetical protein
MGLFFVADLEDARSAEVCHVGLISAARATSRIESDWSDQAVGGTEQ